jgi:hypothetical protein
MTLLAVNKSAFCGQLYAFSKQNLEEKFLVKYITL